MGGRGGGTGGKGQVLRGNQQALISPGCRGGSGSSLFMSFSCRTSTLSTNMDEQGTHTCTRRRKRVKACIYLFLFFFFMESSAVMVKAS